MRAADKKRMEKKLLEQRRELIQSFKRSQETHMQPGEEGLLNLADRATESYTKEFLYRLSDTERARLKLIDEALERMDEGIYGECRECGDRIPDPRLKAVPWASLCIKCQEEVEAAGTRP